VNETPQADDTQEEEGGDTDGVQ
jgi:hypothetical protein